MLSQVCVLLAVLSASLAPARAADVDAGQGASRWSGPWAGVLGAAGWIGGDGAVLGVAGGYALQFDSVVVGIDGDLSGGSLDARRQGGRLDVEAFGTVRARIGYAFERFVAFGTGGLAFASTEYARDGERDRRTQFGWTAGGGIDVAVTDRLSARAEFLYVDLDRRRFDASGAEWYGPTGGVARFGLNYKF